VIPEKADQAASSKRRGSAGGRPVGHDAGLYKDRNTVERTNNKVKEWRGLAARHDKAPQSYLAGLHLRGALLWSRSLPPLRDQNSEQAIAPRPGRFTGCRCLTTVVTRTILPAHGMEYFSAIRP
jgi:hypothetical protein